MNLIAYLSKWIYAFIFLSHWIDAYVLSCLGSHKQARGVYGARAGKENIFLTYKQVMKIFSLPTCSAIPTSYLARARRYDK